MSNEPTIEQMNEAIALFTGAVIDGNGNVKFILPADGIGLIGIGKHALRYHSSWDWLMPVVEKISKLPLIDNDNTLCTDPQDVCYPRTFGMPTEDGKRLMVRFSGFSLHTAPTLIEAAHMAVYEVAEYHNKQQSNDTKQ